MWLMAGLPATKAVMRVSDRELDAMATAWTAIASLDDDARRRVCWWLSERTKMDESKIKMDESKTNGPHPYDATLDAEVEDALMGGDAE